MMACAMLAQRTVRVTQAILAALPMLAAARSARADDPRGDARGHYARGLELGAQNGYEGALREFNEAYAISPQFAVLYNIGQAHIALGQPAQAIEALSHYLKDGGDRIPAARRTQVQIQIAVLRSQLPNPNLSSQAEAARAAGAAAGAAVGEAVATASATAREANTFVAAPGTLTVRCSEPGLKILLDGRRIEPAASARGVPVAAGVHRLLLSGPGRRGAEQSLEVPVGVAAMVICESALSAAAERPRLSLDGPPVFSDAAANLETPTVHASTVKYILGGLGVALGGTALGLYLWNRGQDHDAQAERNALPMQGTPAYRDSAVTYNEHVGSVVRDNDLAIGLAVASVGLIAGGIYLWRSDRRHAERSARGDRPSSVVAASLGGVSWSGVW
jgi:tetratricopeptide (TPR) repeat protein